MRIRSSIISILLLLLAGSVTAQDRLAVFEFEGIGVDPETLRAATHVFRNELAATGKFEVISRADMESRLSAEGITEFACYAVDCAAQYGFVAGAEKAVIGAITRLGDRMTVEVNLVSIIKREVEFSDQFSVEYVDDLNSALAKLADAVASRKKIVSELDRYDITEEETKEPRRKASYTTSGAGFGISFPIDNTYNGIGNLKNLAWVFRYEVKKWVVESSFGITWGSGGEQDTIWSSGEEAMSIVDQAQVVIFPWDIGMRYITNRESDFTPFFGGGIGLHFIVSQDVQGYTYTESDAAFAFHASGGIYMFQSYDFRLTLEGKYTLLISDAFTGDKDFQHQVGIFLTLTARTDKLKGGGCGRGAGCGW